MRVPVLLFDVVAVAGDVRTPLITLKSEDGARAILQGILAAQGRALLHLENGEAFTVDPRTGILERPDLADAVREGYTLDNAALAAAFNAVETADDATRVKLGFEAKTIAEPVPTPVAEELPVEKPPVEPTPAPIPEPEPVVVAPPPVEEPAP